MKTEAGKLIMDMGILANTTAMVYVPAPAADGVTENGVNISTVKDITITGTENGYVVLKMGSGKYHFESSK